MRGIVFSGLCLVFCACGSATPARAPASAAAPAAAPVPAAGAAPGKGAVGERVKVLRDAADELSRAQEALDGGNKNLAEQRFSTAELLIGPEALASIANLFREGAPPRVTTPTVPFDKNAAPQPAVVGNSEADDEAEKVPPPPPPKTAKLTGKIAIDGKGETALGLVTLEPVSGKWKRRKTKRAIVEQRDREYFPKLTVIPVGSTVSFPNFDGVFHNVFSRSPAAAFDLGLYRAGEAREYTFEKPGIVRIGCNLHANMSAFVAVVDAPAFVVSDEQGNFSFRRLLPGKYKLKAWSVKSKEPIEQVVTLKPGKNEINVSVSADAPAGPAPDKFGGSRG
jgi:plastocyanin